MQNGSHPHPPRSIEKSVPEVAPIQDFMDFLYYRSTRKYEKGFVKLFSWTVFFFLACYACACETNDLENSSNPFSYPRTPSRPWKRKRKKEREIKERMKGTLLWKKNLPSRRRGAQNKRWRKRKKKQKIIQRWRWHSKSARNTWTESQNSLAYQLGTLATRYDKMPLRDATFLDRSTETNVFSMNFNQEITISVVWAKRKKNK